MITWFANILLLISMWLIGRKNKLGFVFSTVGESIWVVISIYRGSWDLAFICFVFTVVPIYNYYLWWKTEAKAAK